MELSASDITFFQRAVRLAKEADERHNLPIGALIVLDGEIIAEGRNTIWQPAFNPNRHAEIEALGNVPRHLWPYAGKMTLYTTLEPCLMCAGAILLHQVGRVLYGASDPYGGASMVFGHMPVYFEEVIEQTEWIGPAFPDECDPLYERIKLLEKRTR